MNKKHPSKSGRPEETPKKENRRDEFDVKKFKDRFLYGKEIEEEDRRVSEDRRKNTDRRIEHKGAYEKRPAPQAKPQHQHRPRSNEQNTDDGGMSGNRPPKHKRSGFKKHDDYRQKPKEFHKGPKKEQRAHKGGQEHRRGDGPVRKNEKFRDRSSKKNHERRERNVNGVEVHGEIEKKKQGFAFLLHKPEDIFIPPNFASQLLNGDSVKATVNPRTGDVLAIEVTKRALKQFIGTYDSAMGARKVIFEERGTTQEIAIKTSPNIVGLQNGDKVLAEIIKYEPFLEGHILKTFGQKLAPKLDTFSVVVRSGWPQEFSPEVMKEAEEISRDVQAEAARTNYPGRRDLRNKHIVTIDGKDSRDFDDAVLVEKTENGFTLFVAVADVAEFVVENTPLDDEAYGRATSVYFPEWVIPMLPEALSNGACSLRPNEEKLTLVCEMHYTLDGKKKSAKVYEAVIKSHRRCIYEDVQKEFEAGDEFWKVPYELFKKIRISRFKRGALDLDLPEAKVVLDADGNTIDIKRMDRVDAHKVIEEFMIAANESVTEIMERESWPFVYRVHEPPKEDALERLESFANALGVKTKFGNSSDPKSFSEFIESIKDKPFATTLNYLLLRSLKQARYEPDNLFHFGLASKAYTHFTSPIRRYPDLIVHRILKKFIRERKITQDDAMGINDYLIEACDHCSKQERKAEQLDRQVTKIKKARFMEKKLGDSFEARISNVSEHGIFVELDAHFVEGMVPIDSLGMDYYEYVESRFMIRGKRSGQMFKIGNTVNVTLVKADIESGNLDFVLTETIDQEGKEEDADL